MEPEKKKIIEIFFAEETCRLLGESWEIFPSPDEEDWPDLIVKTKVDNFGLEARRIYPDETKQGSLKKRRNKIIQDK